MLASQPDLRSYRSFGFRRPLLPLDPFRRGPTGARPAPLGLACEPENEARGWGAAGLGCGEARRGEEDEDRDGANEERAAGCRDEAVGAAGRFTDGRDGSLDCNKARPDSGLD